MIFVNNIKNDEKISKEVFVKFLKCLAPLAPYITEELFQKINNTEFSKNTSIHISEFPIVDEKAFAAQKIIMPVQINGKLICTIEVSKDTTQEQAIEIAKQNERFAKTMQDKSFSKVIFVPSKILSIILN